MALKVELKPHERIIIGACVVTNTDQRARLLIDGDRIPILREKDILTPETADTPAKLVYLAVQLMYLSPDPMAHHPTYFSLVRDILSAMPSAWPFIEGINNHILNGDLYHALKQRGLVQYGRGLIRRLQHGLQRQDLGCHFVLIDALDGIQHRLRHSLELGLTVGRGLHRRLRAGELGLHVLDRLLTGLRRQVRGDALRERRYLRARICAAGVGRDRRIHRDVLQFVAERLLVGASPVLNGDRLIDARDCGAAR